MAKKIGYIKTKKMEPRPGVKYATEYYIQTLKQRKELYSYVKSSINELGMLIDECPELGMEFGEPQKGFPKTSGGNRTGYEILEDMANELKGKKRDGTPKDIARAPLDRWNKLLPQYQIEMTEMAGDKGNMFDDLFK